MIRLIFLAQDRFVVADTDPEHDFEPQMLRLTKRLYGDGAVEAEVMDNGNAFLTVDDEDVGVFRPHTMSENPEYERQMDDWDNTIIRGIAESVGIDEVRLPIDAHCIRVEFDSLPDVLMQHPEGTIVKVNHVPLQ